VRIAAIVQRYGVDVVGGAERLCRGVAAGLAAGGHEVEVLTSCARSYQSWANAFPEGVSEVAGVRVRRFRAEQERDMAAFNAASERLFGSPRGERDEEAWVRAQGPFVPALLDHLQRAANDFDRLLFFTYLYYPTVHGIRIAPGRSVLVPAAHDEAPIYLPIYEPVFALPAGMIFNSEAEAGFVRSRFSRLPAATTVIGVGIDHLEELASTPVSEPGAGAGAKRGGPAPGSDAAAAAAPAPGSAAAGLEAASPPALLYAGRIEAGKGVGTLIEQLRRFRAETGTPVSLWLMGEVAMELPAEDWIEVLGFVPEAEKVRRLRAATVLMAPSPLESFGIVVLEAMAAGTPVLANAASAAAVEHCRKAGGGLYYRDDAELRAALELLLADARLRAALARKGASYVRENYSWPRIVGRYADFLQDLRL
jgi:glycosyltransferase involved in cell wall biosynthesis